MGHFALGAFAVCQYFWQIDLCLVFGSTEFLGAIGAFYSLGVMSGTIGINYSHEMMHQKTAVERWMADVLLAMVLYSHFAVSICWCIIAMSEPRGIRSRRAIMRVSTGSFPGC